MTLKQVKKVASLTSINIEEMHKRNRLLREELAENVASRLNALSDKDMRKEMAVTWKEKGIKRSRSRKKDVKEARYRLHTKIGLMKPNFNH